MDDESIIGRTKEEVREVLERLAIGDEPHDHEFEGKMEVLYGLFGRPGEGGDTGCIVGGPAGNRIYKDGRGTSYIIGGPSGKSILDWKEDGREEIAMVGGPSGKGIIVFCKSGFRHTGYFIGGPSGRQILFDGRRQNSQKWLVSCVGRILSHQPRIVPLVP